MLQPALIFLEVHVLWVVLLLKLLPFFRLVFVHKIDYFLGALFLLLTAFCTVSLQSIGDAHWKETSIVPVSLNRKYIRHFTQRLAHSDYFHNIPVVLRNKLLCQYRLTLKPSYVLRDLT